MYGNHIFGADEEAREFSFCGRRHDKFDDMGEREDCTVVRRDWVVLRAHEVSARPAAGFADIEVGSIRVGS
jgi:hypothetical protein